MKSKKPLTLGKLIETLSTFDKDLPVCLTDGWEGVSYDLREDVVEIKIIQDRGRLMLDIDAGGHRF